MARQQHGIQFEKALEPAFPGFVRGSQLATAAVDIPAEFDSASPALPTSVKTTQSRTVCLADARRFLTQEGPYRLLVGRYEKRGDDRVVYQVREYHIDQEAHQRLCAGVDADQVEALSGAIKQFGPGQHHQARQVARAAKSQWQDAPLSINPKIDSKAQRRVQCSVKLDTLDQLAASTCVYEREYRTVSLPLALPAAHDSPGVSAG